MPPEGKNTIFLPRTHLNDFNASLTFVGEIDPGRSRLAAVTQTAAEQEPQKEQRCPGHHGGVSPRGRERGMTSSRTWVRTTEDVGGRGAA